MALRSAVVNSSRPLLVEEPSRLNVIPARCQGRGIYEVGKVNGQKVDLQVPWGDLATPQGYGYFDDDVFVFRRVDRVWIKIRDPQIGEAIDAAVKIYRSGRAVTFDELSVRADCPENKLSIAYAIGVLGDRSFPREREPVKRYIIKEGWLSRVSSLNSYDHGLALFENVKRPLAHVATYWWNGEVRLTGRETPKGVLEWEGGVAEDEWVISYAIHFDGRSVMDIVRNATTADLRALALLVAVGILEINKSTYVPLESLKN